MKTCLCLECDVVMLSVHGNSSPCPPFARAMICLIIRHVIHDLDYCCRNRARATRHACIIFFVIGHVLPRSQSGVPVSQRPIGDVWLPHNQANGVIQAYDVDVVLWAAGSGPVTRTAAQKLSLPFPTSPRGSIQIEPTLQVWPYLIYCLSCKCAVM